MIKKIIITILFFISFQVYANEKCDSVDDNIKIVSTIPAVHSLVLNLTNGTGAQPDLLIKGNVSPHDYMLSPSDMKKINDADAIFFISPMLETFINKPYKNKNECQNWVELSLGINLLETRENMKYGHINDDYEDNEHDYHLNHKGQKDYHIWLSLVIAIDIAETILNTLVKLDVANKNIYEKNFTILKEKLVVKNTEIAQKLQRADIQKFIVFHDAFQYFEKDYNLINSGVMVGSLNITSAKRYKELKDKIKKDDISCIIYDNQSNFKPTIANEFGVIAIPVDLPASKLNKDENFYFKLIDSIANSFGKCTKTTND